MFSMNRVFIAFFLQGIIYIVIASILGSFVDKHVNHFALIFIYYEFFTPYLIYAILLEILQKYIKKYIVFTLIGVLISIAPLFYNLFFKNEYINIDIFLFSYILT